MKTNVHLTRLDASTFNELDKCSCKDDVLFVIGAHKSSVEALVSQKLVSRKEARYSNLLFDIVASEFLKHCES